MTDLTNVKNYLTEFPWLKSWISQFDDEDREIVYETLSYLTYVSSSDFINFLKRKLSELCIESEVTALYCVRKLEDEDADYLEFESGELEAKALKSGNDQGSEAIVCNIIEKFSIRYPETILNNPGYLGLKENMCRHIILIDDIIGSGERTEEFLDMLWSSKTIKSWRSLGIIKVTVLAYAGTELGMKRILKHKLLRRIKKYAQEQNIIIEVDCPTVSELPIKNFKKFLMRSVFQNYGSRTLANGMNCGYENSCALLVFQHGCPDNVPSMFWAYGNQQSVWTPLFKNRFIEPEEENLLAELSGFRDMRNILLEIGQKRLAQNSGQFLTNTPKDSLFFVLGLISKGKRKSSTLCNAMGTTRDNCRKILNVLIDFEFITTDLKLTSLGRAELSAARKNNDTDLISVGKGDAYYFPTQLRRPQK